MTTLNYKKIAFFCVGLFWIAQVNPITLWIMSVNSGLGFGRIRASLFVASALLLLCLIFIRSVCGKTRNLTILANVGGLFLPLIVMVVFRVYLDIVKYGFTDLIGLFPFFEFLVAIFIFSTINIHEWLNKNVKVVKLVAIFFLGAEVVLWLYSNATFISFGVFRANIGGLVLNRMPDLFFVGIATAFLHVKNTNSFQRALFILAIIITLYRSAYLAVLTVLLYNFFIHYKNFRFFIFIKYTIGSLALLGLALLVMQQWLKSDIVLTDVLWDRLSSTFLSESSVLNESSKSQRIDQIMPLMHSIAESPIFGNGFAFKLLDAPIYNYFNYILIALAIIGVPLLIQVLMVIFYMNKCRLRVKAASDRDADMVMSSILVFFFVLINVFPYVVYFPIASVFAFGVCYYIWRFKARFI